MSYILSVSLLFTIIDRYMICTSVILYCLRAREICRVVLYDIRHSNIRVPAKTPLLPISSTPHHSMTITISIQLHTSLRLPIPYIYVLKLYIISWFFQKLSSLHLNVLVLLADTTMTKSGRLLHIFTTLLVKLYFHKSYLRLFFWSCKLLLLGPTNLYDQLCWPADTAARWRLVDYVLPHQHLWSFSVLVCPHSASEHFLLQLLVCGTGFHRTSLLPPSLSIFYRHLKSHLFSLS